MATSWISRNACSTSDPTQDTVKVDLNLLNKKNVLPLQAAAQQEAVKASEEQRQREEARRRKGEAVGAAASGRRKGEAVAAAVAEAKRKHEEDKRAKREKAPREQTLRRNYEVALRHKAAAQAAAERAHAAHTAAHEERQRQEVAQKEADAKEKVNGWCRANGFQDMNTSKKTYKGGTKFPLHTAVKHGNQEIIGLMLLAGVDKDVRDSKTQTPSQLAAELNKNGSHNQILAMLC